MKTYDLLILDEKYYKSSNAEKSAYVASLIRGLREELKIYIEYLELIFKKNVITFHTLNEIEMDFSVWCERVYQITSKYIIHDYIHEVFVLGFDCDELLIGYKESTHAQIEIPKDKLMAYAARIKTYLDTYPLKGNILKKLTILPESVLVDIFPEDEDSEMIDENFSNGSAIIGGEEVPLPFPFYTVAKYLEKMKAFSEEKAISQNNIHQDLNLPFATPRLKQWKKIKGKPNPLISKIFEINSRGFVWLKVNVKVF